MTAGIVGYLASALASTSLIPQVIKVAKTRSSGDLSYGMIAVIMLSSTLWHVHGWMIGDWPLRIASFVTLIVNTALALLKHRYDKEISKPIL